MLNNNKQKTKGKESRRKKSTENLAFNRSEIYRVRKVFARAREQKINFRQKNKLLYNEKEKDFFCRDVRNFRCTNDSSAQAHRHFFFLFFLRFTKCAIRFFLHTNWFLIGDKKKKMTEEKLGSVLYAVRLSIHLVKSSHLFFRRTNFGNRDQISLDGEIESTYVVPYIFKTGGLSLPCWRVVDEHLRTTTVCKIKEGRNKESEKFYMKQKLGQLQKNDRKKSVVF